MADETKFRDEYTVSGPLSAFMQPGPVREAQELREKLVTSRPRITARIARIDEETSTIWLEPSDG